MVLPLGVPYFSKFLYTPWRDNVIDFYLFCLNELIIPLIYLVIPHLFQNKRWHHGSEFRIKVR
jgi:hypothetical protein